jgi:hypothetical protein
MSFNKSFYLCASEVNNVLYIEKIHILEFLGFLGQREGKTPVFPSRRLNTSYTCRDVGCNVIQTIKLYEICTSPEPINDTVDVMGVINHINMRKWDLY